MTNHDKQTNHVDTHARLSKFQAKNDPEFPLKEFHTHRPHDTMRKKFYPSQNTPPRKKKNAQATQNKRKYIWYIISYNKNTKVEREILKLKKPRRSRIPVLIQT